MYLYNLPRSAARTLALCEIMYNPELEREEILFDGQEVGLTKDVDIVITYEVKKKRSTHPINLDVLSYERIVP